VSRRLCSLIARRRKRDARIRGQEADLYQHVYEDVWKRFDYVWERFRATGRALRWSGFEAFLQVTLRHSLGKAIDKLTGEEVPRDDLEAASFDPRFETALDAQRLLEQAFAALSGDERDALRDRHVLGRSSAETGRRLGLSAGAVDKLRHRALRRFRNEVIRIVGEGILRACKGDATLERLVRDRCRLGHACFLFKIDCRAARAPAELEATGEQSPARGPVAQTFEEALAQLAREVSEALAQRGIPCSLDTCIWEPRDAGAAGAERDHE
jgi:RNA polymerase sigma factor (sigma-70 family)